MAEKEYIEREAAIEAIDESLKHVFVSPVGKSIMDKVPAADVRHVVRGKWRANVPPRDLRPRCSVCGELQPQKTNYCPNCGADMREEQDGR